MSDAAGTDPSVCYRHPNRQSWILCQRCGRTICPECQILAPVGVQCPECVREAGGSVKWTPTGGGRSAASSMRRSSAPRWLRTVGGWLRPDGGAPSLSWGLLGASLLIWVIGIFTSIPFLLLGGFFFAPASPFEIWRLVTGMVVYPPISVSGISSILTVALSSVFWLLNAPSAERSMGRQRFAVIVLAGGIVGTAAQILLNGAGIGLYGALFAIFTAYLIEVWSYQAARNQMLIMLLINIVLSLLLGGGLLPEIIGGGLAGAGAFWMLTRFPERVRTAPRTPYLLIAAGVVVIAVLTIGVALARG